MTYALAERAQRTLDWSGYAWNVKSSDALVGPGPNYFSDSSEDVWVDESDALHLNIVQRDGTWYSTEIFSQIPMGYGTYSYECPVSDLATLNENAVLGLFIWDYSATPAVNNREIDIEFSRWGNAADTTFAQFVVQPYYAPGNLLRFAATAVAAPDPICSFDWHPDSVKFQVAQGATVLAHWLYQGADIPEEGVGNPHLNLWMNEADPPSDGQPIEVVIKYFHFTPFVPSLPVITTQPQSQPTGSGRTAALSVAATSETALFYQWYQGDEPDTSHPVGANAADFTTPVLTAPTSYWVRVYNTGGYVDSATAVITPPPCPTFPYTVPDGDAPALIDAMICANHNGAGSDDVINLTLSTYTLLVSDNTRANGDNGLPMIVDAASAGTLTINGNGATIERDSSAPAFRLIEIASGGNLTLNNLTLDGGHAKNNGGVFYNKGGAVFNGGTLAVNGSTFSDNTADYYGGGLYNTGSATVIDSTFSGNASSGYGGGIDNDGGTLIVTGSTFTHDRATYGGSALGSSSGTAVVDTSIFANNGGDASTGTIIAAERSIIVSSSTFASNNSGGVVILGTGALEVSNSTFTDNTLCAYSFDGVTTITNSTFSGNITSFDGCILSNGGVINLGSSIVAGNDTDVSGAIYSLGYNLIGDATGATITGDTATNLVGAAASPLNLGALVDNGGATQTIALLPGSVAINAGDPAFVPPPDYDQRGAGFPRVINGRIDIGAYESDLFPLPPADTNLMQNGDFADGTNFWNFYGPIDYWAPGGMLQFKHKDNSAPGGRRDGRGGLGGQRRLVADECRERRRHVARLADRQQPRPGAADVESVGRLERRAVSDADDPHGAARRSSLGGRADRGEQRRLEPASGHFGSR